METDRELSRKLVRSTIVEYERAARDARNARALNASIMRTKAMAHSTLIVASSVDAPRIGATGALDQTEYPHFHCGSLDVGIFGQVFWDVSEDKHQFRQDAGVTELLYSNDVESVVVHALPLQVLQRYARLSDEDIAQIAIRWARPNGHIRMPRSADFYRPLMQEIARLARIAIREHKALMVRTQFRGVHNKPMQPAR